MERLTKRRVEALEPGTTDYIVWDAELPGFGVRVLPSGRKAYLIQYRRDGRTRRKVVGKHGVFTADEARAEARKLLGDVARGGDPSGDRKKRLKAPDMAALLDRFMEEHAAHHCKPHTRRAYESIIRLRIKPELGTIKVCDIERADILAMHHALRAKPYQANRAVMIVSKALNLAEDWGLRPIGSNPARRVRKFREVEKKRYLSDAEQARLGEALQVILEERPDALHAVSAIFLLMLTGCRLNEIVGLRWDWVTPSHLELPDSKTGRRRIPLPREAYDILMALPRKEGNPHVIIGNTPTGHRYDLKRVWDRARALAKLPDVRLHDLRHTYASVAVMNGVDPFVLKEILGHKNLTTTLRYAHLADHAVQSAAGSVAARIAGVIGR